MSHVLSVKRLFGDVQNPSGLAYDRRTDLVYVCDMQGGKVKAFRFDGAELHDLETACRSPYTSLERPLAISMDEQGRLIVTDAIQNAIFRYVDRQWVEIGLQAQLDIQLPGSVTCDHKGNVYFTDFHKDAIYSMDPGLNVSHISDIDCQKPYGIYWSDDMLYVADFGHARILWYDTVRLCSGTLVEGEISPIAVTCDDAGNVYYSENRKLYRFRKESNENELLLDRVIWKQFALERLCHIGAIVTLAPERILISDTIKNCIYEMTLAN